MLGTRNDQVVGENAVAVQAKNINELNIGLMPEDVKIYCIGLFEQNFPRLRDEAAKQALENMNCFAEELKNQLIGDMSNLVLDKFSDPDVQMMLNEATLSVARKGGKVHPDILIELIKTRILIDDRSEFLDNLCSRAVEVVAKITKQQLHFLLYMFLAKYMFVHYRDSKFDVNNDLHKEKVLKHLFSLIERKVIELESYYRDFNSVKSPQINYLQSLGLVKGGDNTFSFSLKDSVLGDYKKTYEVKDFSEIEKYSKEISPSYLKILENYDVEFKGSSYGLSPVGLQIVFSYLETTGIDFPLKVNEFLY